MPECAGGECSQARAETGLLPLWRDAQVDVVAQPIVGVHVPVPEVCTTVLRSLQAPWVYILETIP